MTQNRMIVSELKDARISILRALREIRLGDHVSIIGDHLEEADRLLGEVLNIIAPTSPTRPERGQITSG